MHTVDACISCMDDIDLLKMGQRKKKKYGMNAIRNSITKLFIAECDSDTVILIVQTK